MNESGNSKENQKELTARQIFDRIVKGEVIRISNDPELAKQLFNHLNVIKSREAKIFRDLGLDYISAVISIEIIPFSIFENKINGGYTQVRLKAPKIKKKYAAFIIAKQDEPINI